MKKKLTKKSTAKIVKNFFDRKRGKIVNLGITIFISKDQMMACLDKLSEIHLRKNEKEGSEYSDNA